MLKLTYITKLNKVSSTYTKIYQEIGTSNRPIPSLTVTIDIPIKLCQALNNLNSNKYVNLFYTDS